MLLTESNMFVIKAFYVPDIIVNLFKKLGYYELL